jgi:hypothetical protein
MNLTQLVDYITTKAQLLEADDVAACRMFVSKRYELIWNQYLWKDSLVMLNVPLDPTTNADHAEGVVLLPEECDRVVAIRTTNQAVRVQGLEYFYNVDYDRFSLTGSAAEFSILNPIWFVWRGETGLRVAITDALDNGKVVQITWRDATGVRFVQQITMNLSSPATLLSGSKIVVSGAGFEFANSTYTYASSGVYLSASTDIIERCQLLYQNSQWELVNNGVVIYHADSLTGTWVANDSANDPAPVSAYDFESKITVESFFNPALSGTVGLIPSYTADPVAGLLTAGTTASPSYQRIRLFNIPTSTITLNVLGKKKFVPLDFDQQVPALRNLDNCLIAFAMGDLLLRARQYAKSAQQMQEGAVMLSELAKLETIQAANHATLEPASGFGNATTRTNTIGLFY